MQVLLRAGAISVLAGLVACSGGEASRDDAGAIASQGTVDAAAVAVGDCINDPVGADSEGGVEFTDLQAVPCDQPHDSEVYHQFELPDADFPGGDAVLQMAGERCEAEFAAFVGLSYDESGLDLGSHTPTEDSWAAGDRNVSCIVFEPNARKVSGTLKGAAR